jgi:hypothetical protein
MSLDLASADGTFWTNRCCSKRPNQSSAPKTRLKRQREVGYPVTADLQWTVGANGGNRLILVRVMSANATEARAITNVRSSSCSPNLNCSGRVCHVLQYVRSLKVPVLPQCVQKTRFAEFFSIMTSCLCDPIGIETQDVSGLQPNFGHGTVPVREQAEYRGGRIESLEPHLPCAAVRAGYARN